MSVVPEIVCVGLGILVWYCLGGRIWIRRVDANAPNVNPNSNTIIEEDENIFSFLMS